MFGITRNPLETGSSSFTPLWPSGDCLTSTCTKGHRPGKGPQTLYSLAAPQRPWTCTQLPRAFWTTVSRHQGRHWLGRTYRVAHFTAENCEYVYVHVKNGRTKNLATLCPFVQVFLNPGTKWYLQTIRSFCVELSFHAKQQCKILKKWTFNLDLIQMKTLIYCLHL